MKAFPIVLLIAFLAIGLGIYRNSLLVQLNREQPCLQGRIAEVTPEFGHREFMTESPEQLDKSLTFEKQAELKSKLVRGFHANEKTRFPDASPVEQEEAMVARKELLTAFSELEHDAILELIGTLRTSGDLPLEMREKIADSCVEMLISANPQEALRLIPKLTGLQYTELALNRAFTQWAAIRPREALFWFDEQSKKPGSISSSPGMLKSAMLILARIDPACAVSVAQMEKLAANPAEFDNLGAIIAGNLQEPGEHSAFLLALRREQESSPDSPLLAKLRREYIEGLMMEISKWSFEEARLLLDAEFTPAERRDTVARLYNLPNLYDRDCWATWFSKIDFPLDGSHPMVGMIVSWTLQDPDSAGKWLEDAPAGELRDRLVATHASQLANFLPARAMEMAMTITDAAARAKSVAYVSKSWKAKDPSAAAAFAKQHDLPE